MHGDRGGGTVMTDDTTGFGIEKWPSVDNYDESKGTFWQTVQRLNKSFLFRVKSWDAHCYFFHNIIYLLALGSSSTVTTPTTSPSAPTSPWRARRAAQTSTRSTWSTASAPPGTTSTTGPSSHPQRATLMESSTGDSMLPYWLGPGNKSTTEYLIYLITWDWLEVN